MPTIIIGILIGLYCCYVVFKKIKDMKKGKFCNCGCDHCPSSVNCKTKD